MRIFLHLAVCVVLAVASLASLTVRSPAAHASALPVPGFEPRGYWTVTESAAVSSFGAPTAGSGGSRLNAPVVGASATRTGSGLWLAAADGGIFTRGTAPFVGSAGAIRLNQPVVGIASSGGGAGYWLVARDGGIFAYGDAPFYGSAGNAPLNQPITAIAPTPGAHGYWLGAADGGVFSYGDASFFGSTGSIRLNSPIVALVPTVSGRGYWLVAADGGVFSFGDARFHGSTGNLPLNRPIVNAVATPSGRGYWLVAADGGVFSFGDAAYSGSTAANGTGGGTVAIVAAPRFAAAETSIFYYPWYANPENDGVYRHWDQGSHTPPDDVGANYYPVRGAYSSSDPAVVDAQMAEIKRAGVDTVVVSWWGRGSFEDTVLPRVIASATVHGLRVAGHIEPYDGRSGATLLTDYVYLQDLGVREFYVYLADMITAESLAVANASLPSTVRAFAESGNVTGMRSGAFASFAARARFTGIYTYDAVSYSVSDFGRICGSAHAEGLLCSPSTAPGWNATRATPNPRVVERGNGARYDHLWQGALDSRADVVSITSYNEWHEGTQIEPAQPFCPPVVPTCYLTYEGAYGTTGDARNAYIDRTRFWTDRNRQLNPG